MTTRSHAVDVRRRAGWLPEGQDDLESWLDGHRERVEAKGEQVVLHPVMTEFQELIDTIEAEDPVIGLMAFVAVGMSEVSSCLIGPQVTPGYHVGKGEELGYFQYGGSTHCLVFRPGAIAEFALAAIPQPHDPNAPLMLVRSKLAIANTAA